MLTGWFHVSTRVFFSSVHNVLFFFSAIPVKTRNISAVILSAHEILQEKRTRAGTVKEPRRKDTDGDQGKGQLGTWLQAAE